MIDSIRANHFMDWELIAVDDGSDVATLELMQHYASIDQRIRFLQREKEPKGAQTCRNIGLDEACGEFIVFFDSDDYITPTCLETRVHALQQRTDVDFMVFPSGVYEEGMLQTTNATRRFGRPVYKDDLQAFARRTLPFIVWNNIYRTASLRQHHIRWDVKLKSLQDADYNVQTLLSGLKYTYADAQPDYAYRLNITQSISTKLVTDEHFRNHIYAQEKFFILYRQQFGHQYDSALYQGVLFLYDVVCREEHNKRFATMLTEMLRRQSRGMAFRFGMTMKMIQILALVLPHNRARQISLFGYLLKKRFQCSNQ